MGSDFKSVFLRAVEQLRSEKKIGPWEFIRAKVIAARPNRLAEMQQDCCEQLAHEGYAIPVAGDAAFDWNTFFEQLMKWLPIILAFFKPV